MTNSKPEHDIKLTREDEKILDKAWRQVAARQGKGEARAGENR